MLRAARSTPAPRQLRWGLGLFVLAVAVPAALLIDQAYRELRWEAFHQLRVQAEELTAAIGAELGRFIAAEEIRPFDDYAFWSSAGDSQWQRSPLSAFPVISALPGVIGYFQVDPSGRFSSPLLPGQDAPAHGIPAAQWRERQALVGSMLQTLGDNRLVSGAAAQLRDGGAAGITGGAASDRRKPAAKAPEASAGAPSASPAAESAEEVQAPFDRLSAPPREGRGRKAESSGLAMGRVEDLQLDERYQREAQRRSRQDAVVAAAPAPALGDGVSPLSLQNFEREREPLAMSLLASGHVVLFRKHWRNGQRYIQGVLIATEPLVRGLFGARFGQAALSQASSLIVAWRGGLLASFPGQQEDRYPASAAEFRGALLYRATLPAPLQDVSLIYSVQHLPRGPGAGVITWLAVVLAVVLLGGALLMYRLGMRQIALMRQQQDFVAAVSHELRTPLTAIRMYAELLQQGWAPAARQAAYYAYIHSESERLSRLIEQVLQLARMTRNGQQVELKPWVAARLLEDVRQRLAVPVERAGFSLVVDCADGAGDAVIAVDRDYFVQIFINLVDNGLKFAAAAQPRVIALGCRRQRGGLLALSVRDYGPGVAADQVRKIFRPFYRAGDELTRETTGTGIGLALVREMAEAMGARVAVVDRNPGAEFTVVLREFEGAASKVAESGVS